MKTVPGTRKRKGKSSLVKEAKIIKIDKMPAEGDTKKAVAKKLEPKPTPVEAKEPTPAELAARYPILKDSELVKRFLSVAMTNNQKGRIRQALKDNLKGTSNSLLPDVIHTRIQSILKASKTHTDSDLRKLRILYNMLITVAKTAPIPKAAKTEQPKKKVDKDGKDIEQKVKGPKRYVVFVGNLPLGIDKEKIIAHFSLLSDHIKSVRLPKRPEGKKSAIAYLELSDEPSYELALSKHHSMLQNKRINVLYTTQQKTKVSKAEAKGKSAKLVAMQKSGQLIGSVPLNRKRSARRKKMKAAQKKMEETA